MGLVADSSELSLFDLIQVKGQSLGRCSITIKGSRGPGLLCLADGHVVCARYAGLAGLEAAHAILLERDVSYRATSGPSLPPPNLRIDHRQLLMEVAVRADEAAVIQLPGAQQPPRSPPAPPPPPVRRRAGRMLAVALGGLAVAAATVLAVTGTISIKRSEAGATVQAPPSLPAPPRPGPAVEVSSLTGPRDAPPVLMSGEPPRSPAPDQGLRPTVVLRLLVDESGRVAQAEVYQPRSDLGDFERAALEAVRHFAFRPARRDGELVPAWVNWPVDFI